MAQPTPYAPPHRWEELRECISQLYKDKRLVDVMTYMEERHQFRATARMYKDRLNRWGVTKNRPRKASRATPKPRPSPSPRHSPPPFGRGRGRRSSSAASSESHTSDGHSTFTSPVTHASDLLPDYEELSLLALSPRRPCAHFRPEDCLDEITAVVHRHLRESKEGDRSYAVPRSCDDQTAVPFDDHLDIYQRFSDQFRDEAVVRGKLINGQKLLGSSDPEEQATGQSHIREALSHVDNVVKQFLPGMAVAVLAIFRILERPELVLQFTSELVSCASRHLPVDNDLTVMAFCLDALGHFSQGDIDRFRGWVIELCERAATAVLAIFGDGSLAGVYLITLARVNEIEGPGGQRVSLKDMLLSAVRHVKVAYPKDWQMQLCFQYYVVGTLNQMQPPPEDRLAATQECVELARELALQHTGRNAWFALFYLNRSLTFLSNCYRDQGGQDGSTEHYDKARETLMFALQSHASWARERDHFASGLIHSLKIWCELPGDEAKIKVYREQIADLEAACDFIAPEMLSTYLDPGLELPRQ